MGFKTIFLAATAFVVSGSVNAALIDNGTFITDTETGLDWIKLSETRGLSYNFVNTQTSPNGAFEDWIIADFARLEVLFDHAGGVGSRNQKGQTRLKFNVCFLNELIRSNRPLLRHSRSTIKNPDRLLLADSCRSSDLARLYALKVSYRLSLQPDSNS